MRQTSGAPNLGPTLARQSFSRFDFVRQRLARKRQRADLCARYSNYYGPLPCAAGSSNSDVRTTDFARQRFQNSIICRGTPDSIYTTGSITQNLLSPNAIPTVTTNQFVSASSVGAGASSLPGFSSANLTSNVQRISEAGYRYLTFKGK